MTQHPLYGKKIAVIGDSISTAFGQNTPYWEIKPVDMGRTIRSYVSWFDIYNDIDPRSGFTGKRIGGILLTDDMVGEMHDFSPLPEDIGKTIGDARNYNSKDTRVWHQRLCDYTGATLLANASWSGSTMVNALESRGYPFKNTHAWSDYTIGCCHVRNDEGEFINPDVILIARGNNDFCYFNFPSYRPLSIDRISIDSGITWHDDLVNGITNFNAAYYLTIQKLRSAYPDAQIFCCTVNVFKLPNAGDFPTRNQSFTLPAMNDAIRQVAQTMGCDVVSFDKSGITLENCYPAYMDDDPVVPTHPNNMGHELLAKRAMSDIRYVL